MDLTVVVGLDAATLEQWKLSLPTIAANRPELFQCPWCVFYDRDELTNDTILADVPESSGLDIHWFPWPSQPDRYASQRAKMLAGFVHVPRYAVKTKYWMKIDTDAVAVPSRGKWFDEKWFHGGTVIAAPSWGYTKAKGDNRSAAEWAEALEAFGDEMLVDCPRLNLAANISGTNKITRKRFCSWLSFYETKFTTLCAELCEMHCGDEQIPVPSQDTTHWYIAERAGLPYKTVNMKRHGWAVSPRTRHLVDAARDALTGAKT
jgi:hypothetical protein